MQTFKANPNHIKKCAKETVKFDKKGEFKTEDKDLIDELKKDKAIKQDSFKTESEK